MATLKEGVPAARDKMEVELQPGLQRFDACGWSVLDDGVLSYFVKISVLPLIRNIVRIGSSWPGWTECGCGDDELRRMLANDRCNGNKPFYNVER